jgi:hypothetical protein
MVLYPIKDGGPVCKEQLMLPLHVGNLVHCLMVPATTESHYQAQAPLDSERQRLLDQLHSLPTLSMNEDPTEVLRQIRSQRRIRAIKNHE